MNNEKDRAILVGLQLNDGSSFEHNLEEQIGRAHV